VHETVSLGRIAGVRVAANWSLLIIAALIAETLAVSVLPATAAGRPAAEYWVASVAAAVAFLAGVLAHELAHAIVARRCGIRVDSITLWMLGGVTRLDGDPPTPRDDLRVAVAGPAASAGIGLVCLLLAVGLRGMAPVVLVAALQWLGAINVLLALFNLLPGAPLDGGRLLRAVIWQRTGDRARAAVHAARAGRVVGFGLVSLGVVEVAVTADVGGIWLMLVGWFLLVTARAEERHAGLRNLLVGVQVRDVMTSDPLCGPDWLSVQAFLDSVVRTARFTAFPLRGVDGRPSGLVTLHDLARVAPARRVEVRVGTVGTPLAAVPTAGPDEPLIDVIDRLGVDSQARPVLVVADDQLGGILTSGDISAAVQKAALADPVRSGPGGSAELSLPETVIRRS